MPRPFKKITLDELEEKEKKINDMVEFIWNRNTLREVNEMITKNTGSDWNEISNRLKLKIRKMVI